MTIWDTINSVGLLAIVILAFSVLIFVHELGHFLAAVAVGVRVERFFVGFDIYGWALKWKRNGVVYGIGALPLGGYVKLAGQSDDPRSEEITGAPDELRSKPLWAQALVFVAGVTMNMIFGFLLLVFAYMWGFPEPPSVVGVVQDGMPAQIAGLEPGDAITHVDGVKIDRFRTIQQVIAMNPSAPHTITFDRPGTDKPKTVQLYGIKDPEYKIHRIGIGPMISTKIGGIAPSSMMPYLAGQQQLLRPGDQILSIFGEKLDNEEYDGTRFDQLIAENPAVAAAPVVVRRNVAKEGEKPEYKEISLQVPIPATGVYDLGYRIDIRLSKILSGTAADKAGLESGDVILSVLYPDKPERMFLQRAEFFDAIRSAGYQPTKIKVLSGADDTSERIVEITPRFMGFDSRVQQGQDTLLGIIAKREENGFRVETVFEDGPAAGVLQPGDLLTMAGDISLATAPKETDVPGVSEADGTVGPPTVKKQKAVTLLGNAIAEASTQTLHLRLAGRGDLTAIRPAIDLKNGLPLIGAIISAEEKVWEVKDDSIAKLQGVTDDCTIFGTFLSPDRQQMILAYRDKEGSPITAVFPAPAAVQADPAAHGFIGYSGVMMTPHVRIIRTSSIFQAMSSAGSDTAKMSLSVYKMIHKLVVGEMEMGVTAGPLGVMDFLYQTAKTESGFIDTLRLIAMISINLAVFNLLPFFVLDGGHLLFLLIEWIKGSPPNIKLREYTQYFGIICLLALALYVTTNDVGRFVGRQDMKQPFNFSNITAEARAPVEPPADTPPATTEPTTDMPPAPAS